MRKIVIRTPIWSSKSVGIADYKITDDLEIEIAYQNQNGERLYPYRYFMNRIKAKQFPVESVRGVFLHIIPISEFEIIG